MHSRPKHTLLYRWLLLYPLYALSEIAIIATDLAELLGSGIALALLFPKLPLWAGVLITASDVFVLLALRDPLGGRPVRIFEVVIAVLVGLDHFESLSAAHLFLGLHRSDMHGCHHRPGRCSLGRCILRFRAIEVYLQVRRSVRL